METPLPSAPRPRIQVIPWYTLGGACVLGLAVALSVQPQLVHAAGLAQGATAGSAAQRARTPILLSAPASARPAGALRTPASETLEPSESPSGDELGLR